MQFHRLYLAPALGIVVAAGMTACSSGGTSSTPPASSSSSPSAASATSAPATSSGSAVSQITTDWQTFFSSSTSASKRLSLLQNGSTFGSAVSSFSSSPIASAVSAKVDSVKVTSSTQATVTYDLEAAGQTVEKNAKGLAVYQDGTWKVGDSSFCGLLTEAAAELNMKVPAVCSSSG